MGSGADGRRSAATPRGRLRSALHGEPWGRRIPWSPLIDGYFLSSMPEGVDALEAFGRIGADALVRHVFTWRSDILNRREPDMERSLVRKGSYSYEAAGVNVSATIRATEQGTELRMTFAVEGRELSERFVFTGTSPFIPFPLEFPIKTVDDLHAWADIERRDAVHERYADFAAEDARIGDRGMATDSGPTSPIQAIIQHLIGIEAFYTTFLPDHAEEVGVLLRAMHEKNLETYEVLATSPAEVVIDYENTSSTLISPELYARWCAPAIDDYADIVHRSGKIFLTHRCGKLKNLLPLIAVGRDDGIADLSPLPTGDVSLWEARKALPGKVLLGGIDATVLAAPSPGPARDAARDIIARLGESAGVILGSGDAVPQNANIENLSAVTGVIDELAEARA